MHIFKETRKDSDRRGDIPATKFIFTVTAGHDLLLLPVLCIHTHTTVANLLNYSPWETWTEHSFHH